MNLGVEKQVWLGARTDGSRGGNREKHGVGIEGSWGKDRGKHGVKVEGSKSEDRWRMRKE